MASHAEIAELAYGFYVSRRFRQQVLAPRRHETVSRLAAMIWFENQLDGVPGGGDPQTNWYRAEAKLGLLGNAESDWRRAEQILNSRSGAVSGEISTKLRHAHKLP